MKKLKCHSKKAFAFILSLALVTTCSVFGSLIFFLNLPRSTCLTTLFMTTILATVRLKGTMVQLRRARILKMQMSFILIPISLDLSFVVILSMRACLEAVQPIYTPMEKE